METFSKLWHNSWPALPLAWRVLEFWQFYSSTDWGDWGKGLALWLVNDDLIQFKMLYLSPRQQLSWQADLISKLQMTPPLKKPQQIIVNKQ